jgi:hypothetical protein
MSGELIGFLVILGLGVAATFLFRSMNKHLRRVPPTFEEPPPAEPQQGPDPTAQSSPRS